MYIKSLLYICQIYEYQFNLNYWALSIIIKASWLDICIVSLMQIRVYIECVRFTILIVHCKHHDCTCTRGMLHTSPTWNSLGARASHHNWLVKNDLNRPI